MSFPTNKSRSRPSLWRWLECDNFSVSSPIVGINWLLKPNFPSALCISIVETKVFVEAAARLGNFANGAAWIQLFRLRKTSTASDAGCSHGKSRGGVDSIPPIGPQMLGTPWPQIAVGYRNVANVT